MENVLVISTILLWMLMLLNILFTVGLARRIKRTNYQFPRADLLDIGQIAPNFTAYAPDGEEITLATYAGQATAFIFISPHCKPCREELPKLNSLYVKAKQIELNLVLVSDSDKQEISELLEKLSVPLPILTAPREQSNFFTNYKVATTPFFYLINTDGQVQAAGHLSELGSNIEAK